MLAIVFGGVPSELASLESRKSPGAVINGMRTEPVAEMSGTRTIEPIRSAKARLAQKSVVGIALAGTFAAIALLPTAASAQVQPGCTTSASLAGAAYTGYSGVIGGVVGATNTITSVIGTMNTAFIAQGNAFVAGLPNATPDQLAGGFWGRMVGGRVDDKASGTFSGTIGADPFGTPAATGTVTCNSQIRQDYGGFQVGQDLARLNLSGSGATLHLGVTGGYAQSAAQDQGGSGFTGGFQVPFIGAYAAYTNGNFFADALVRGDYYQMSLNAADAALTNQQLNAFGLTESASAGYRINLNNDWFVEPSVSGIHSGTKVDTLNLAGGFGNLNNFAFLPPSSISFSEIESWLGRVGVRVGTSFTGGNVAWQPFATASVWHEFAGQTSASYFSPDATSINGNTISGTLTGSRVGTYGQYSLGIFGQVSGTPWLGYLRLDYKEGANIEGVGFNAGLRYQFDPSQRPAVASGIYKAPPRAAAYDWTGFYAGAFTGAAFGRSRWFFPTTDPNGFGSGLGYGPAVAGGLLGGTLGYNKQYDRWVLGFEGDAAITNATGGQSCTPNIFDAISPNSQNCNDGIHVVATADVRVGYTPWDRVLVYAKGGGAWTNNALNVPCNTDASSFLTFTCFGTNTFASVQNLHLTDSRFGGTVGAGFELALTPKWSAKAEYDFLDFGSRSFTFSDGTLVTVKEYVSEVKLGVNYHFNAADDPATSAVPIMATKMPVKAPMAAPYNWTGAYAGVEARDRIGNASWNTTQLPGANAAAAFFGGLGFVSLPDPTTNPAPFFSSAMQGGVFGGYDWQIAPKWVTGIEGDVAFGNSSMTRGGIPGTYGNGAAAGFVTPGLEAEQADSSTVRFGWDGSVRGRLGYLSAPDVLIYGTGGVAFQQVSVGAFCNGTDDPSFCGFNAGPGFGGMVEPPKSETYSTVRVGWTLGAGLEGVLTGNWIGKLDFRYANFGNVNHNFFAGTVDEVDTSTHLQTYTFAAGLGYKFNGTGSLTK
jgi:opacity protein-like surface antigen